MSTCRKEAGGEAASGFGGFCGHPSKGHVLRLRLTAARLGADTSSNRHRRDEKGLKQEDEGTPV